MRLHFARLLLLVGVSSAAYVQLSTTGRAAPRHAAVALRATSTPSALDPFATLQKLAEDSGGAEEVRNVVREKLVHGLVQRAVANVATGNLGAPAPSSAANNLLSCFAPAWASSDASQTGGWLWW